MALPKARSEGVDGRTTLKERVRCGFPMQKPQGLAGFPRKCHAKSESLCGRHRALPMWLGVCVNDLASLPPVPHCRAIWCAPRWRVTCLDPSLKEGTVRGLCCGVHWAPAL